MLHIHVKGGEYWDERNEEFIHTKPYTLTLEHSLVSISKWEAKWHKPFLETKLTSELFLDYIKQMTIEKNVPDDVYARLTSSNLKEITAYMQDTMTASRVKEEQKSSNKREYLTSELLYYWMTKFNIPFECEKWHINRLIMLIKICFEKEKPQKKMTNSELYARHAAIKARNRSRRK